MRAILFLSIFVVLICGEVEEEHIVRIVHGGGSRGQDVLDMLFDIGITSLEHPKLTERFVDAYVSTQQLKLLNNISLHYSFLPNIAKETHRERLSRKRALVSTSGNLHDYHDYEELSVFVEEMEKN
jgi:hypothetical protein